MAQDWNTLVQNAMAAQKAFYDQRDADYTKQQTDITNQNIAQLDTQRAYDEGKVNTDIDKALRGAFVSSKLSLRDLPARMSAMGLYGGPTESTIADVDSTYQNARNSQELARQDKLSTIGQSYGSQKNSAMTALQSLLSAFRMQNNQGLISAAQTAAQQELARQQQAEALAEQQRQYNESLAARSSGSSESSKASASDGSGDAANPMSYWDLGYTNLDTAIDFANAYRKQAGKKAIDNKTYTNHFAAFGRNM